MMKTFTQTRLTLALICAVATRCGTPAVGPSDEVEGEKKSETDKTEPEQGGETDDTNDGVPSTSFERPPYIAIVSVEGQSAKFALIGAHSKPSAAIAEANWLDDVWRYASSKHQVNNGVILGDLNLSCDYATSEQIKSLDLRTDTKYRWLIPDTADTNVADSQCSYDRIIVTGEAFADAKDGTVGGVSIGYSDHKPVSAILAGLKIGAFNAKVFGDAKAAETGAISEVASVICSSDITLVQEIVSDTTAPADALLSLVKKTCDTAFEMKLSNSAGTTSYKERFAYFYNSKKATFSEVGLFPQIEVPSVPDLAPESPSEPEVQSCGVDPYKTPKGYCFATKDGVKKRVANSCCADSAAIQGN